MKVLVGLLRIDSYFKSSAIPTVDLFLDISKIEVNLFNEIQYTENTCDLLKDYKLADENKVSHLFLKNHITSLKLNGQFFDDQFMNFEMDSYFNADIIDFKGIQYFSSVLIFN